MTRTTKLAAALAVACTLSPDAWGATKPPTAGEMLATCKINVNAASPAQLSFLIRTGPSLAAKIAEARTAAGGSLDPETLDQVAGIGEGWLAANAQHVAYTGPTTCTAKLIAPPKQLQLTATDDKGQVWHVCRTKPRRYEGTWGSALEMDHYLSKAPCPEVPID